MDDAGRRMQEATCRWVPEEDAGRRMEEVEDAGRRMEEVTCRWVRDRSLVSSISRSMNWPAQLTSQTAMSIHLASQHRLGLFTSSINLISPPRMSLQDPYTFSSSPALTKLTLASNSRPSGPHATCHIHHRQDMRKGGHEESKPNIHMLVLHLGTAL